MLNVKACQKLEKSKPNTIWTDAGAKIVEESELVCLLHNIIFSISLKCLLCFTIYLKPTFEVKVCRTDAFIIKQLRVR